jgi:rfaE bifunctional protein kinase chain/domain
MTKTVALAELKSLDDCVLAYGHFSVIHLGHLRYLRYAKAQGKKLVVALIGNGLSGGSLQYPFTQLERSEALSAINLVDYIVLLEDKELTGIVSALRPKIIVLGTEYESTTDLDIKAALAQQLDQGREIRFHSGEAHYSSTELLSNSGHQIERLRLSAFLAALDRQGLQLPDMLATLSKLKNVHLVVLGDTIVDRYVACEAMGMSAEAPVIVVRELESRNYMGGAAIVAAHVSALGAQCTFFSVVGNDEVGDYVSSELQACGVNTALIRDANRPTTLKKRYVVENQKLFRVSRVDETRLDKVVEQTMLDQLEALASSGSIDGIIVSDFVYGVVTPEILSGIGRLAEKYQIMLFGDLQCSSQVGAVTRFTNFDLICPNEREARIALQDKDSGLEVISNLIFDKTNCKNLIMKLGSEGFIVYGQNGSSALSREHFPALTANPVDVMGAGDSLLAVMATGIASGQSLMSTAALASCMASLAVERMGNTPVSEADLRDRVLSVFGSNS